MTDFNLINSAVAAASFGFLASLAVTLILALVCRGLYRKALGLQRELDAAKESKRVLMGTLHQSYLEKARLTVENARLAGRIRDLLLQRRALGFALFYSDDEIAGLKSELRSTNRQLLAAHCRNGRVIAERDEAREAFRSAETRLLRGSRHVSIDVLLKLGEPRQRQLVVVGASRPVTVIEYNNGTRKTLVEPTLHPQIGVEPRPAPSRVVGTWRPGRVQFRWQRNAVDNTAVEYSLNGGPWLRASPDTVSLDFIMPDNVTTLFRVRNVWDAGVRYSTPSNHVAITSAAGA